MSQEQWILEHLEKGFTITPLEALEKFGCFRLGARIYNLIRQGHDIRSNMVRHGKKHFAQYWLAK